MSQFSKDCLLRATSSVRQGQAETISLCLHQPQRSPLIKESPRSLVKPTKWRRNPLCLACSSFYSTFPQAPWLNDDDDDRVKSSCWPFTGKVQVQAKCCLYCKCLIPLHTQSTIPLIDYILHSVDKTFLLSPNSPQTHEENTDLWLCRIIIWTSSHRQLQNS